MKNLSIQCVNEKLFNVLTSHKYHKISIFFKQNLSKQYKMSRNTRKNNSKLPQHAATFDGVECWFKAKYEKLGWMVLANAKGYTFKINPYKMSIKHLLMTIEHLMKEYHDEDKIHDLKVLHMDTKLLMETANKLF